MNQLRIAGVQPAESGVRNRQSVIVVVGVSLGGLRALETVVGGLPREFPWPLAVVQHRSQGGDDTLAVLLQNRTALRVTEACDKEPIRRGHIYLAPSDYHMLVEEDHFSLSTDDRVNYSRPSIDVLFESAADAFGAGVIGVVLTGANDDGARGAARIKARGGCVIVQDPATAESPTMPTAALAATTADQVLPLEEIAPWLGRRAMSHGGNGEREIAT